MSDVQIDNETKEKYDENSRKILKKFIEQLNSCNISKGEYPKLASADLKYTAMLQGNRLREKHADISYNYVTENAINTVEIIKMKQRLDEMIEFHEQYKDSRAINNIKYDCLTALRKRWFK